MTTLHGSSVFVNARKTIETVCLLLVTSESLQGSYTILVRRKQIGVLLQKSRKAKDYCKPGTGVMIFEDEDEGTRRIEAPKARTYRKNKPDNLFGLALGNLY